MAATEFTVSDVRYSTTKMNGMAQFHVSRRLAPLLAVLPIITRGRKAGDTATPITPEQTREVMAEVTRIMGTMRDEDVDYVMDACLSRVTRYDAPTQQWISIWNASNRRPMYEDINMIVMIMICFHVVKASLGPFTFAAGLNPAA